MRTPLLFALCCLPMLTFGQKLWNQKLPFYPFGSSSLYLDLSWSEDRFLVASGVSILEMDQQGVVRGVAKLPAGQYFANFARRKYDSKTGDVHFLTGCRKISLTEQYGLRIFNPDQGFIAEILLPDTLESEATRAPCVLALDDSTVVVFGKQYGYKVRIHDYNSFSLEWKTNLNMPNGNCRDAVWVEDHFVLFSKNGGVVVLDSLGQQVFTQSYPYGFEAATVVSDGIVVTGRQTSLKAMVFKFDFSGELRWMKEFEDNYFMDIKPTPDGNIAVVGRSKDQQIVLKKMDPNGQLLWSKTYQNGIGHRLVSLPDGGFLIGAVVVFPSIVAYFIKTNANGETTEPQEELLIQNRRLKNSGVQATFEPNASLFFDGTKGTFLSPPDSTSARITSFAPWIGALDTQGDLHLSADRHVSATQFDTYSGVLGGSKGDFKRVWRVSQEEISALRHDYLIDAALQSDVPFDILTWPARGNPQNLFNLDFTRIKTNPNLHPAPFVDFNGDGIYNVYDGDYPQIKGDQMAWWILNDDTMHFQTQGLPLGIDIAVSAYLYDCPQPEDLQNALFVDFAVVNRSTNDYPVAYMGFYTDFSLGCNFVDDLGSIPQSNTYYGYSNLGQETGCDGTPGHLKPSPIQSISFPNQSMDQFIFLHNMGIGDGNPYNQWEPKQAQEYFNYLQAKWRDGVPLSWGGNGNNPGNTNYTSHAFPSNPSDATGWSMCTSIIPIADRRALGAHGPFYFGAGDTFNITIMFLTSHNNQEHCPDIFSRLNPVISQITTWANTGALEVSPDLGIVQSITPGKKLTLDPGVSGSAFAWSTGATTPTLLVTQPGEYTVTVTLETGCQKVEKVSVIPALAPGNPAPAVGWFVYPNPADEYVELNCPRCNENANRRAIVRNALGAELLQLSSPAKSFTIPLKQLPSGFYWIEFWQGDECWGSRKIMRVAR